jgi:hypothetical protein
LSKGTKIGKLKFCENYVMGKQCRVKFSSGKHTFMGILNIFIRICGVLLRLSLMAEACILLLSFITTPIKFRFIFWNQKMRCLGSSRSERLWLKKEIGKQVKMLRTDNGLESLNAPFDEFYKKDGIMRYRIVRHTL